MKVIRKLKFASLLIIFAAIPFAAGVQTERVSAHEGEDHTEVAQNEGANEERLATATYTYTAQPGDSFAAMARKAVQTYGIINKVNLSQAQIIFAETNLTIAANSPELNEGQSVAIDESAVKSWVERAEKLSNAQKAAWEAYTVGVDFNTDNVGETR